MLPIKTSEKNVIYEDESFSLIQEKKDGEILTIQEIIQKNIKIFEFHELLRKEKHYPSLFGKNIDFDEEKQIISFKENITISLSSFLSDRKTPLSSLDIWRISKTLLHGFSFLQLLQFDVSTIPISAFFITKNNDIRLLDLSQIKKSEEKENFIKKNSENFCEVLKKLFIGKKEEDLEKEDKKMKILMKFMHKEGEKNLLKLFKKTLFNNDHETMKKIILLEDNESFMTERAQEIVERKKFEIVNTEQTAKIFGLGSVHFFQEFNEEKEAVELLTNVKPIYSLNVVTRRFFCIFCFI